MKKMILLILLSLFLVVPVNARGLFGLDFGYGYIEALEEMEEWEFELLEADDTSMIFIPLDNDYISQISLQFALQFSPESFILYKWQVCYLPQEDEDIKAVAIDAIQYWHEEEPIWQESSDKYYLALGENKHLYAFYNEDKSQFIVEYVNKDYE